MSEHDVWTNVSVRSSWSSVFIITISTTTNTFFCRLRHLACSAKPSFYCFELITNPNQSNLPSQSMLYLSTRVPRPQDCISVWRPWPRRMDSTFITFYKCHVRPPLFLKWVIILKSLHAVFDVFHRYDSLRNTACWSPRRRAALSTEG